MNYDAEGIPIDVYYDEQDGYDDKAYEEWQQEQDEELYQDYIRDGGDRLMPVANVIGRLYGLKVGYVQVGRSATVYLRSPTEKNVFSFAAQYDGEVWTLKGLGEQSVSFEADLREVQKAIWKYQRDVASRRRRKLERSNALAEKNP